MQNGWSEKTQWLDFPLINQSIWVYKQVKIHTLQTYIFTSMM